ncbi:MAG: glycerophosphodiester phosphodiesterase [Elusimicrobia bacterium]|nr:glycerophosphodiester phosphodiesterase [Elusimicrobiota bacterium]
MGSASAAAPRIAVHGHRGSRGTRPENTLAAFKEALRVGVDVLELDLGVTKDGVVVVSHDPLINPVICSLPGGKPAEAAPLRTLTYAELSRYDCGSLRNPRFPRQVPSPGERMPLLSEVFALVKASTQPAAARVELNMETKLLPGEPDLTVSPEEFAALLAAEIKASGFQNRVIVQSFDRRTLEALRRLAPKLRLSMLISDNLPDLGALAAAQRVDFISPDWLWITKADVDAVHAAGAKVAPWTVNDEKGWARMVDFGVDAVITDYPEDLIVWLKAKGLR